MRKFIGFGMLLALIVAPMATALGATGATNVVAPIVAGAVGPYDSIIGVANISGLTFTLATNPIKITTLVSAAEEAVTIRDRLDPAESKFYLSSDFNCSGVCQVAICAPIADTTATPSPVISASVLWLNNGEIVSVVPAVATANIIPLLVPDLATCPDES
jgi:hypothetical protein